MKANNLNHIHYERLIAVLEEESREKDFIIQLLKDRINDLTTKQITPFRNIGLMDDNKGLIESINYN